MEVKAIGNDFPQPTQTPQSRRKNKKLQNQSANQRERGEFQPGFVRHLQSLLIKPFRGLIFLD